MNNTNEVKARPGEYIGRVDARAVQVANQRSEEHWFRFNDMILTVTPGATESDVIAEYERRDRERVAAYEASPEGQRRAAEAAGQVKRAQADVDLAVLALDKLDFRDVNAVLAWCERFTTAADLIGVNAPRAEILSWFRMCGWMPNMNCDAEFNGEDRDNFAGYVIGQALDGIDKMGVPHPLLHGFVEQWRQKFAAS